MGRYGILLFIALFSAKCTTTGTSIPENAIPYGNPDTSRCYKASQAQCATEAAIFRETNQLRARLKLPPLVYNHRLAFVARDWSEKQEAAGRISHDGFPDARRLILHKEFKNAPNLIVGENLVMSSHPGSTPEVKGKTFVKLWQGSKGHYENMTRRWFNVIGVGVSKSGKYATQIFGVAKGLSAAGARGHIVTVGNP